MIHTVRIDDNTRNGKKLIAEIQRYKKKLSLIILQKHA